MRSASRPLGRIIAVALALTLSAASASAQTKPAAKGLRGAADDPATPSAAFDDSDPLAASDSGDLPKPKPRTTPLPPLRPYKGAQRLDSRGGPVSIHPRPRDGMSDIPAATVAAIPAPPPRRIKTEEDPYAPLGLRVGDLKLTPYVEEDLGYSTNPTQTFGATKGSGFETTEAGVGLQSDWSRHDLHGQLKAGYTDYFGAGQTSGGYGSGALDGRLDVTKDLSFDGEGRFTVMREPLASLGVATAAGGNPQITASTYGATLGAAQKFGDLTLALHGTWDRTAYQDLAVVGGGLAGRLSTDDFNDWGLRGRVSYRVSEAVSPFLEIGADTRVYDATTDASGYARGSTGATAKAGVTVAFSQLLSGEASLGYGQRHYKDPRLAATSAPLVDASLIWKVTPLTTVTWNARSQIQDAVVAGASADINRSYSVEIAHALTRQIKLGLTGGYATDSFVGLSLKDTSTTFGATAEYHLNRDVVLKASATRQQFTSTAPNSNYVNDSFMVGVRVQR